MSDSIALVGLPPEGQCGLVAQKSNVNPRCCRRGR